MTMKKLSLFLFLCLICLHSLNAQNNISALLPMPNHVEVKKGNSFSISERTGIYVPDKSLQFEANELQRRIEKYVGSKLHIQYGIPDDGKNICLMINPALKGSEHYQLDVSDKNILISGASSKGVFYGIKTLEQVLIGDACNAMTGHIAPLWIDDSPRFAFRAFMLDPARHFLPMEDVKFFIDKMADYKYNVLQLHLTDDQGWRIEIKKYPKLTEMGAFRNKDGGKQGPDNGYYTQEQIKEIIEYAAKRHVEVIPEMDIPGHTAALLAVYPELGCIRTDTAKTVIGKTTDVMLCANQPEVYEMYRDIIAEVSALFPSKKIHLGGDEALIEKNWAKCVRCQKLMTELEYTKASDLMNYFFDKMLSFVRENKKEPILWCELDNIRLPADSYLFDYPKDVTLVSWRAGLSPLCLDLTRRHGNPIIMAPGEYAYLDYPQYKGDLPEFNNWGMPVVTLEQVYRFDPGYGGTREEQQHIQGIMATLWAEAIKDINRVTYMAYPRGLALAEAGWTQMENRSWESFKARIYPNLYRMMKEGVYFRVPFEIAERDAK
jgi:hexosaminidase